jgi:phosphoglycolate phosphatase
MMQRSIRHVCFDKDGTLIDVHAYWADIVERRALQIMETFHLPTGVAVKDLASAMGVNLEVRKIFPGGPVGYKPRPQVIQGALCALENAGVKAVAEDIEDIFCAIDLQLQKKGGYVIKALPYVREVLREIKKQGIKVSVYSSDRKDNFPKIFQVLGIEDYFDALVGGDDVRFPKPHPEGFVLACRRTGIGERQSVYVGDTLDDMKMAKLAKAACGLGITTGLCPREELSKEASHVFSDLRGVEQFLSNGK